LFTGEASFALGAVDPLSGQMQGVFHDQTIEPTTGVGRVDSGRVQADRAAPALGFGYKNRHFVSPWSTAPLPK
jgi:hypothetical protein